MASMLSSTSMPPTLAMPALLTTRVTSPQSPAAAATWLGLVTSSPIGTRPGRVMDFGSRAAP
jgi:hypothetical protein